MKRILTAVVLLLCFAVAAVGCSSKEKAAPVKPDAPLVRQPQAQGDPAWKLVFKSSCGELAADQCVGAYGFSVTADGKYEVGPGPEGQVRSGKLDAEDLKQLEDYLAHMPQVQPSVATAVCPKIESAQTEDTIRLLKPSNSTTEMELCFDESAPEEMKSLYSSLRALAEKLYPVPFPNACADAVIAAEALYAPVRACATDKDCAYIDNTFFPIPSGEMQFVISDDCSVLAPLMVGNAAAVREQQGQLGAARSAMFEACGGNALRLDCEGIRGFQATDAAPVCVEQVCRVNPSVTL